MIRITSKREGFRRCGIAHSVAPVEYPDNRWSAEELVRLREEPNLVVTIKPTPVPILAKTLREKTKELK